MIINIIIFYFCTYLIIFAIKDFLYKEFDLSTTKFFVFFRSIFLFFISLFFFFFFRIINFFLYREPIDLKNYHHYNIFLMMIILFILIHFFIKVYATFVFILKYNFLKQHFFLLNPTRFKYYFFYTKIMYFITSWNYKISYFFYKKKCDITFLHTKIYYFFFYFFDVILFCLFIIDFFCFNKILILTTIILPYYGLYKFFFNLNYFFSFCLDLKLDSEISKLLYSNLKGNDIFKPYNLKVDDKYNFLIKYVHIILLKKFII